MFLYYLTQFLTLNLALNKKYSQKCVILKTLKKFLRNFGNSLENKTVVYNKKGFDLQF